MLRAHTTATGKTGAAPVAAPVRHRGVADSGSAAVAALARHIHQAPPASAPPTPPLHSEPPTMRITAVVPMPPARRRRPGRLAHARHRRTTAVAAATQIGRAHL